MLQNNPVPVILLFLLLLTAQSWRHAVHAAALDVDNRLDATAPPEPSSSPPSAAPIHHSADECLGQPLEMALLCRGSRAVQNIIHNLSKADQPIVIVRGLEIVPTSEQNAAGETDAEVDDSLLGRFAAYLRTHELNVKFSDLLAAGSRPLETARDGGLYGDGVIAEARKKDKGQGVVLAMALMMAKTMAMLGLGGIGALAMKALGVALMALLLSGLVGLKSLSQQGHESSHSVSYVGGEGHHHSRRRRRSSEAAPLDAPQLAYRGWMQRMRAL